MSKKNWKKNWPKKKRKNKKKRKKIKNQKRRKLLKNPREVLLLSHKVTVMVNLTVMGDQEVEVKNLKIKNHQKKAKITEKEAQVAVIVKKDH